MANAFIALVALIWAAILIVVFSPALVFLWLTMPHDQRNPGPLESYRHTVATLRAALLRETSEKSTGKSRG